MTNELNPDNLSQPDLPGGDQPRAARNQPESNPVPKKLSRSDKLALELREAREKETSCRLIAMS